MPKKPPMDYTIEFIFSQRSHWYRFCLKWYDHLKDYFNDFIHRTLKIDFVNLSLDDRYCYCHLNPYP
jgi:hypothetical protein